MSFYVQRGKIPTKRHTQYRKPDGNLYYEELVSREGFSDIYSNLYHIYPPTRVSKVAEFTSMQLISSEEKTHRHHHFETFKFKSEGNWISGRKTLAFNNDVILETCAPVENGNFFFRNGHFDEMIFVHYGSGIMESLYGKMDFYEGDYIIIPRGVTYKLTFKSNNNRLFILESSGPIETPNRYRNKHGQFLEHAPYCERDIRVPEFIDAKDESGEFQILIRLKSGIQKYIMPHHPFDVVGWDGYFYPWIFNIKDFMPIVGKIHQPPPVHQTFQGHGFVVCSFVPRLFDYHEKSIPAPYAHSNVESDEVLYYVAGEFMSRKGVSEGSLTLHPAGFPHGPQPGKYEESIGKKETNELAVMVDTFSPLILSKTSDEVDDESYPMSWLEK
jgi:homogentisate 1,2-dioxygenase